MSEIFKISDYDIVFSGLKENTSTAIKYATRF